MHVSDQTWALKNTCFTLTICPGICIFCPMNWVQYPQGPPPPQTPWNLLGFRSRQSVCKKVFAEGILWQAWCTASTWDPLASLPCEP
uniref:Uncharacterized protein n=1 Tax=Eutreptiella gymnastica TaxID=73025 RepID=A0A7S1ITH3_9EUGL